MGGKSGSSNNQMIAFEMQQAAEAKQKEAERQARLNQGKTAIDDLFAGGGFDDAFYNKYKDAELGNATSQLDQQYKNAVLKSRYDLARAGLSRSSAANTAKTNLSTQKDFQETGFRTQADQDVAALRTGIQGQQQQAYNQLYATEDPSLAANVAANMVKQGQLTTPNLQPLGELFKPLVIGSISAGQNLLDNYFSNTGGIGTTNPRGKSTTLQTVGEG
jgi:hypothetical protein